MGGGDALRPAAGEVLQRHAFAELTCHKVCIAAVRHAHSVDLAHAPIGARREGKVVPILRAAGLRGVIVDSAALRQGVLRVRGFGRDVRLSVAADCRRCGRVSAAASREQQNERGEKYAKKFFHDKHSYIKGCLYRNYVINFSCCKAKNTARDLPERCVSRYVDVVDIWVRQYSSSGAEPSSSHLVMERISAS